MAFLGVLQSKQNSVLTKDQLIKISLFLATVYYTIRQSLALPLADLVFSYVKTQRLETPEAGTFSKV